LNPSESFALSEAMRPENKSSLFAIRMPALGHIHA
jgi:hypothetical protein